MHTNPAFRKEPRATNLAFAAERGFGVLAIDGPLLSHVPFLIDDDGKWADLHLVRSNPILRALDTPRPAVIAISGPDSYISPDWYGVENQVPTWNYVAVHLRGTIERAPQDSLRDLLDRLSERFEDRLAPKPPWRADKMTGDALERMMRTIVPVRMSIETVDGTWKLNQNKTDDARNRAADAVDAYGIGAETRILAALMRGAGQP